VKLLLDTHVFLWLLDTPEKLSERALGACRDRRNPLYFSIASAWEIQVKMQLGKLTLDDPLSKLVREQQAVNGVRLLAVELPHVLELGELPTHHKDPFDRLLAAQARVEDLHLVTTDATVRQYPVTCLW
jgi:PIN domain nuclease of toxin-antitoxin system